MTASLVTVLGLLGQLAVKLCVNSPLRSGTPGLAADGRAGSTDERVTRRSRPNDTLARGHRLDRPSDPAPHNYNRLSRRYPGSISRSGGVGYTPGNRAGGPGQAVENSLPWLARQPQRACQA